MSKIIIDTNVYLRYILKDNASQNNEVSAFFKKIQSEKYTIILPIIILMEINFVLKSVYGFSKKEINLVLDKIINICEKPKLAHNHYDYALALDYFNKFNIKFIDCLIASIKLLKINKSILITYDHDFKKLPIKSCQPKDF